MSRKGTGRARLFVLERNTRARYKSPRAVFQIEGEAVTADELAVRLGIKPDSALARLRKAQQLDGPVTWERLHALGRKP